METKIKSMEGLETFSESKVEMLKAYKSERIDLLSMVVTEVNEMCRALAYDDKEEREYGALLEKVRTAYGCISAIANIINEMVQARVNLSTNVNERQEQYIDEIMGGGV